MPLTPVKDLVSVLTAVQGLVAGVRPDQWTDPTPCPEWNVRELVNHMVIGDRAFAAVLRGGGRPAPGTPDPRRTDALGDDPVAAYREAAHELAGEFQRPGVLNQVFKVPTGPVPGSAAARLRTTESLVHGWDLARATGQNTRFPDDIVQRGLDFTEGELADNPPDRTSFGPPSPVPDGAPPLTRLTALLGRTQ